ncbi:putative DNA-binding domain-containing protein [Rhodoferax sp.]|uniref:HvfC/BufC family peptide modification chaperone n=1 Tax=Rhodoferax sp. TaxID=50421 RepID=UPI002ACD41C0|nr:putative DNA-binding domain-containing protein [Rhodoferax sp.]MDZ7921394.1 putative DNA-binding domain-containing protein [Rhodoferax sp.]
MSTLAQQQQQLLAGLFSLDAENAIKNIAICADSMGARGLKAYQSNGRALAERALLAAYPVLAQMLGAESFAALARALWHASPPQRGDMAQWGDTLADFVAASPQLADDPYLADVARVEWALHTCASAGDAELQPATLALLGSHDLDVLRLQLAPGTALLCSRWPVASLVRAHGDGGVALAQAATLLRAGQAEDALVWRQGYRPRLRNAQPGEVLLVSALMQGSSLGGALDAAPQLDIQAWLTDAVQSGLLLAVHPL